MKDDRNYHQRLQEFCDCFMETDPKGELEKASKGISGDPGRDLDELALKFLGLGIFYGASEKVNKISFLAYPVVKHDIELSGSKRRGDFILNHPRLDMGAYYHVSLFNSVNTPQFYPDRTVELESSAAWCHLRVPKNNAHFLS